MKKKTAKTLVLLLCLTAALLSLTACGGGGKKLVGTWARDDGEEVILFESDGTCSIPSTYDGAWLESLDRYTVDDEGTLILSSSRGHIDTKRCLKAGSEEEAKDERGYYYLSGDTLILHISSKTRTYERQ